MYSSIKTSLYKHFENDLRGDGEGKPWFIIFVYFFAITIPHHGQFQATNMTSWEEELGKELRQGRWALNMEQSLYSGNFLVFSAERVLVWLRQINPKSKQRSLRKKNGNLRNSGTNPGVSWRRALDDSCTAVLENNWSKWAQDGRGPRKEAFNEKGSDSTHVVWLRA